MITCDEIIDAEETDFNEKNATCRIKDSVLLIATALLIAVSIYCYLKKFKSKQKHLLLYYFTNDKLIKVLYILRIKEVKS